MKYFILLFFGLNISSFTLFSQTSPHNMVEKMGRGINLGNVFSAPVVGNWSPDVEEQYFTDLATAGFTNVRIPIDFFGDRTTGSTSSYSAAAGTSGNYSGTPADYIVSSIHLDRIETMIGWGLAQGLIVTLDFHGSTLKSEFIYTFDSDQTAYTQPTSAKRAADNEKFRAIWAQVAERFKNHSEDLLFEVINEPYFHMNAQDMNTLNSDIISIIRATGSNNTTRNIIITGGTGTSHEAPLQIDPNIISSDAYLIATFHYYQPFNFTSSSADSRDDQEWGTNADKNTLTTRFDEVSNWATTNNIPVFVGEFGADNTGGYKYSSGDLNTISGNSTGFADGGPENASRVEYHRYIAEQAINRGFSFAAWDSGPKSNKTIHMRSDSPATLNYNIANFSVNTYDPKNTNTSTIIDTSTWVEDVKDALFESGTWPVCYGPTENTLIRNPTFECGYNTDWSFRVSGSAAATFSDATTDSKNGEAGAKIVVSSADVYNKVVLSNVVYTEDLTDKKITFKVHAKSLNTNGQSFKLRIKAVVNGTNSFVPSPSFNLTNTYAETPFEFEYFVPSQTTSIQLQVLVGEFQGTYFFDEFETTIEDTKTAWLGTTNTDWATNSNWDLGVPVSSSHAYIPSGLSNYPVVSETTAAVVNNLTVENTASLSIENGGSLIVNGASTGNISYNRTITYSADNASGWYLVASPTVGETYDDSWIATHDIVSGAGSNRGIGTYNTQTDDWTYYQAGTAPNPFTSGIGYSIKRGTTSGSLTFNGSINTSDVSVSVISTGNGYNLIGNPYPAYINSSSFLTNNTGFLISETIWLWNSATNNYDAKVTTDDFIVSPSQGFFVQANSDTNLNFSHANQLNNADTFQKSTKTEVKLQISDGTNNRYAKIYYVNNATTGFDNGYDGEAFGGIPNTFGIYTHLLSNNEGKKYQIQSLPNKDFETLVVPIGIQTEAGKEITFTSEVSNLPEGMKVFLEDRQENIFTRLDNPNGKYKIIQTSSANEVGRFYLHTSQNTLNSSKALLDKTAIYKINNSSLRIVGLPQEKVAVKLFNILGKQLLNTSFEGNGVNDIALPKNLNNGVYIVQLQTENGTLNKKIILDFF
jgi:endoglucanase